MSSIPTAENITFANFAPDSHRPLALYAIGATPDAPMGVAAEMTYYFGHTLTAEPNVDNLGELIRAVGPAKELQDNAALVRAGLGTEADAVAIARGWSERSGLLVPVQREYATGRPFEAGDGVEVAVVSGGDRDWMARSTNRLLELAETTEIGEVLLIAGSRTMNLQEGPDVFSDQTEYDYMAEVVAPRVGRAGLEYEIVGADSERSDEVMRTTATWLGRMTNLALARIAVISNAGAWPQNTGQLGRALKEQKPQFDATGLQLIAVSDGFRLGTGAEPTSTHQNPFTAAGLIARDLQEFARHT